jgi:hypothetical protein
LTALETAHENAVRRQGGWHIEARDVAPDVQFS